MTFHVGQKVVYVGGIPAEPDEPGPHPVVGAIYTVTWIDEVETRRCGKIDHIDLEEIPFEGDDEWLRGYDAREFRPVTDISIFTALLDGLKQGEPA
jgi:hypothetical protein